MASGSLPAASLEIFPVLAGYIVASTSLLLAIALINAWRIAKERAAFRRLSDIAQRSQSLTSSPDRLLDETEYSRIVAQLISMTFPIEVYAHNYEANVEMTNFII